MTLSRKATPKKYIVVTNKSYGNKLKGTKIYFEGKQPKSLRKDGSISFGKNILELLLKNYKKFHWIITVDTNEITRVNGIFRIRTSVKTIQKMYSLSYDRARDVKIDIIKKTFSVIYPKKFKYDHAEKYKPGDIASILSEDIINDLSSDDKDALNKFLPGFIAKESVSAVNVLKATTQIKTLKELATEIKAEIKSNRSESWWQKYIHRNILIIHKDIFMQLKK
jgi:hypothetical protein